MSRPKKIEVMKFIIDAIRLRPLREDEIKIMLNKRFSTSEDALRKRRYRYMQDLTFMGIVELSDDKYHLRLSTERTEVSYDIMVKHSLSLIPALRQIARIAVLRYSTMGEYVNEQDMRLFIDCARDHLRYYPDVWKLIVERIKIDEKAERMEEKFRLNLMEKLKSEFSGEPIVEPGTERKRRSFIGANIPSLICSRLLYDSPTEIKLEDEEIWFGGSLIAKGTHLLNGVREFVSHETEEPLNIETVRQIEKTRNSTIEIRQEIEREIRKIILRIESGIPLRGGCKICAVTDQPP